MGTLPSNRRVKHIVGPISVEKVRIQATGWMPSNGQQCVSGMDLKCKINREKIETLDPRWSSLDFK